MCVPVCVCMAQCGPNDQHGLPLQLAMTIMCVACSPGLLVQLLTCGTTRALCCTSTVVASQPVLTLLLQHALFSLYYDTSDVCCSLVQAVVMLYPYC